MGSWIGSGIDRVPTPKEICMTLDKYVIGQNHGKKVLNLNLLK